MFEHEQLLKSTPLFSWFLVLLISLYWSYLHFFEGQYALAHLSLDLQVIYQQYELYRFISGPLFPGIYFRNLLMGAMGVHTCTWFTINAYEARWERIIMAFNINFFALLVYTYLVDSLYLQFPLVVLLSAMVVTTYLMQEVSYTVPPVV